ncbi:DHH family phosphoesterase [Candidatus Saccharibacteria bacterium]|nr:DHH family phosphoesterase [Candidatus Saccharibacteria bacterium]
MEDYSEAGAIADAIADAEHIVVVQADNPDTDSLASSLALEHILEELGKKVTLYCGVDLPTYLEYLDGSDRVIKEFPKSFDASIIVDTSSDTLLEQLEKTGAKAWLASKPSIVIDHHSTKPSISFSAIMCCHPAVATTEIIYGLAKQLGWALNKQAKEFLAIGILSDSLGLMSEATTAKSIHTVAELVEGGIKLAEIDSARRATMRREPELIRYKGLLLQRVEFHSNNRIATVTIPWEEIEKFSPLYNPSMLVIDDMRLGKGTDIAICFKVYRDKKVTAKIRSNYGRSISDKIAEHFGGGGHPYASGFKVQTGQSFDEIKAEAINVASSLLDELEEHGA